MLADARSKVIFQTAADDARQLAREFGRTVSDEDFLNLGQYEVLLRLATSGGVSQPVSGITKPPSRRTGVAQQARDRSRQRYGRALNDVQAAIEARRSGFEPVPKKRPRLGATTWE